ncbi:MAG: hypothetical protein KKA42_04980 [candidate division Zixibacteria bacterium]|nr:hypothetical protein [candidate division Zixibacteria bacterium]
MAEADSVERAGYVVPGRIQQAQQSARDRRQEFAQALKDKMEEERRKKRRKNKQDELVLQTPDDAGDDTVAAVAEDPGQEQPEEEATDTPEPSDTIDDTADGDAQEDTAPAHIDVRA